MDIVTYSLSKSSKVDSDIYYRKVADFTDEVLNEARKEIRPIVKSYHSYVNNIKNQQNDTIEETVLELLILGVFMSIYSTRALSIKKIQYKLLTGVINIRKSNEKLKPVMNHLKGIMSTLFLFPNINSKEIKASFNVKDFSKLILWLEASGEFTNEVKRLKKWEEYINTLSNKDSLKILRKAYDFGVWFESRSIEVLGEYTFNVNKYLSDIENKSKWREDILLRQRKRVEYHLNMVGAEIMNRAFRQAFITTNKKVLLLPICMTTPKEAVCQSENFGREFRCKACSSKCQVNKLTVMEQKYGFSVMVVPHESSISSDSKNQDLFDAGTGVIGVACVLNLISGGWLLKDINIPAQCVLLDYCGCQKHWHDKGISTCINLNKLKEILAN